MKKQTIEKIFNKLLEDKKQLLRRLTNQDDVDMEGDETDEIQASLIVSVANKLSLRDREKLLQIDNTISKMENSTFGICEECEESIAEKRLEFNPCFKTCVICAEQKEFEDKQRRKF